MTARTPELTDALSRVNEEEVGRSGAGAPPLCRPSGGAAKASPAEPAVANAWPVFAADPRCTCRFGRDHDGSEFGPCAYCEAQPDEDEEWLS